MRVEAAGQAAVGRQAAAAAARAPACQPLAPPAASPCSGAATHCTEAPRRAGCCLQGWKGMEDLLVAARPMRRQLQCGLHRGIGPGRRSEGRLHGPTHRAGAAARRRAPAKEEVTEAILRARWWGRRGDGGGGRGQEAGGNREVYRSASDGSIAPPAALRRLNAAFTCS